ncbi:MAG TPA: hypothetical protein VEQ59_25490 [Polyangiaceae bacterium]|nr:hypothetical protein [Polyangiaceae bacterium]
MRSKLSRRLVCVVFADALLAQKNVLAAEPPKEKYYFELKAVTPKPELKADVVKLALARVLAELKKAFQQHPQIVVQLEGAPGANTEPDLYRAFLAKSHITGAFRVTVEITDAAEVLTPSEDKPSAKRLETRLALRMLGARIPDDTLGFTGHGKAASKQEATTPVSEAERQDTWNQLAELAVAQAIKTALDELTIAAKAKPKSKPVGKRAPAAAP